MQRDEFYRHFSAFLRELKPHRDLPPPDPDTHLWEAGYLDSFAMLQTIDHLESVTGRDIPIGPDRLSTFFTLSRIYESYVAGASQ